MGEHHIGRLDDVPGDRALIVDVDGREIGVFRVGEELFAVRNRCPHQGGPVAEGGVFPALRARHSPGEIEEYYDYDNPVVACPWHGWEFDLRSGSCLADPARRVAIYEVVVRDGELSIVTKET